MLRIVVDFKTLNSPPFDRVLILTHVEPDLKPMLRAGDRVRLLEGAESESIEVEGVLRDNDQHDRWYAEPDWSTLQYV